MSDNEAELLPGILDLLILKAAGNTTKIHGVAAVAISIASTFQRFNTLTL